MPARISLIVSFMAPRYPGVGRSSAERGEPHVHRGYPGPVADWKRAVRRVVYPAYEARMLRRMPDNLPQHIGVMLDGNRRWAKAVGRDTAHGHRAGAANIEPLLGWCDEVGIEVVTLWLLSTDNLNRPEPELAPLLEIIEEAVDFGSPTSGAGGCTPSARSTCCRRRRPSGSRPPRRRPATSTACSSTSRSGTAAAGRSPTPSRSPAQRARRQGHLAGGARRIHGRRAHRRATSTPRASPIPTW